MSNLIEELKNYLNTSINVDFGYLFGSYFSGNETTNSDIDIALYLKNVTVDIKLQLIYELSKLLQKDVDLVILNEVKNIYLLEDILDNSVVLKDSDAKIDFELVKRHDILDFKEFRKMINAA